MRCRGVVSLLFVGVAGAACVSAFSCAKQDPRSAPAPAELTAADSTVTSSPVKEVTLKVLGMF